MNFSEGKAYKGETYDQFLRIISYFEKQLELFSNLCFGRNYVNKKIMRQKLKSSVLLEYIWNRDLPQELRAAFVSLLLQIHIDSKPRIERIVPLITKKFLSNSDKSGKKRNQTTIFNLGSPTIPKNGNKSPVMRKEKAMNLHDVVLDITKINTITKTLQNKAKNKQGFAELEENSEASSRPFQIPNEEIEENSYKMELIEEFLKDEESIDEEQIKTLKNKIIEFLEKEIYKKPKNLQKNVTIHTDKEHFSAGLSKSDGKDYINFDVLLLNMVEMVRKMVVCECFSFQEKKQEPNSPQKNLLTFFGRQKLPQTPNEFERLIKSLIVILENQAKPLKMKRLDTTKTKNPAGFVTNIFGKINNTIQDATETMKNVATNLGQIFFKDATVKSKKNKKKKRTSFLKLDSVSNFFMSGINVKKKFLKNLTQNDYENYDVF